MKKIVLTAILAGSAVFAFAGNVSVNLGGIGVSVGNGRHGTNVGVSIGSPFYYCCPQPVVVAPPPVVCPPPVYYYPAGPVFRHLIPIGHHGQSYKPSANGCIIRGCTFDNPRHMAIRPYAWADLTIENNTFISTEPEREIEVADALITYVIGKPNPRGLAIDEEGRYLNATYEVDYACPGCLGSRIRGNKFIIKGNRIPRVLNAVGSNKQGMKVTYNMIKIDEFLGKARIFNGYKTVRNMVSDLEFTDNEINVLDSIPEVRDYLLRFENVNGITLANNVINSNVKNYARWYCGNEAVEMVNCEVGEDALTRYIEGSDARGHRVHLPLGNGETCRVHCTCKLMISLYTDARGAISAEGDYDGEGIVTVTAAEGYRFVGWRALDVESPLVAGDIDLGTSIALVAEYAE